MSESKLRTQSMDFAVSIINLVKYLKEKRESIISNQIGRSGTSIGANIREAQYAHGKADFIAKLQIALKEANETGYWLELLFKTNYIAEEEYKSYLSKIREMKIKRANAIEVSKAEKEMKKCQKTSAQIGIALNRLQGEIDYVKTDVYLKAILRKLAQERSEKDSTIQNNENK